jgi:uncharacterized protein (DUF302 family)
MKILWNLLAVVGLLAIIGAIWAAIVFMPYYQKFQSFDDKALPTYTKIFNKLMETGNAAEATIWKEKVREGLTTQDVEDTLSSVANELNIKNVGELPLYKQISAMTGKDYRFVKLYMYCNPLTAAEMIDYNDAFSAYLPCRIAMVEDKQGQLWLITLNMDLMIYGGKPLPEDLKAEAIHVRKVITSLMDRSAKGAF